MLIGLVAGGEGGEEERESHSKVGTLLGPTMIVEFLDITLLFPPLSIAGSVPLWDLFYKFLLLHQETADIMSSV